MSGIIPYHCAERLFGGDPRSPQHLAALGNLTHICRAAPRPNFLAPQLH